MLILTILLKYHGALKQKYCYIKELDQYYVLHDV